MKANPNLKWIQCELAIVTDDRLKSIRNRVITNSDTYQFVINDLFLE